SVAGSRSRSAIVVDDVLEFLAGLEVRDLLGRHFHASASLGVAAHAGFPLPRAETAKAADLDLVAGAQGTHDAVKNRFDDDFAVFARQLRQARDFFDEVGFGHSSIFHLKWGPASRIVSPNPWTLLKDLEYLSVALLRPGQSP